MAVSWLINGGDPNYLLTGIPGREVCVCKQCCQSLVGPKNPSTLGPPALGCLMRSYIRLMVADVLIWPAEKMHQNCVI